MSLNVIDLIKGQLGPALVSQAAAQFGESESGISKAIGGLLPAVVGGLANNSDNPGVLDAITNASSSGILGNLLGESSNNSIITTLLSSIFGDKLSGLVNTIATFAGISNNSSSSLLNLVTGAAAGSIGKYAADNNLGQSGISSLLNDQKGIISSLLPAGLSLGTLGLGNIFGGASESVSAATSKVTETISDATSKVTDSIPSYSSSDNNNNDGGGGSIWKWLLPLLLLIAATYFIWKQCEKKKADATLSTTDSTTVITDSTATITPSDTTVTTTVTKVDEDIDLNGTALKGYKGGMEDQMITFLKTDGYKNAANDDALKSKWYDFDHVNFKIGSATELEAGSEGQLQNLVAILKAFPEAKIKIGGYTDKTGDEAKNLKLSADRANFIKSWLGKQGVGAQVIAADGYGSQFATVDASASNEARAVDRKMAVRFAK
ncbi:OmpA family protein [Chryseobacterium taiwanense]|uniref:Flagellar motor protein MotB n=1 Tax=Chryseobacterium taiwanense TaxID=363331 RepID=A0A0B4D6E5_9FLAO|nr:OmpA family protein [Chryseobacterium taiwanense]KIC64322.1 flagellar motor protein MotB [Chryseobacterium taiwanense]